MTKDPKWNTTESYVLVYAQLTILKDMSLKLILWDIAGTFIKAGLKAIDSTMIGFSRTLYKTYISLFLQLPSRKIVFKLPTKYVLYYCNTMMLLLKCLAIISNSSVSRIRVQLDVFELPPLLGEQNAVTHQVDGRSMRCRWIYDSIIYRCHVNVLQCTWGGRRLALPSRRR